MCVNSYPENCIISAGLEQFLGHTEKSYSFVLQKILYEFKTKILKLTKLVLISLFFILISVESCL